MTRVPDIRQRRPNPAVAELEAILGPALPVDLTGLTDDERRELARRMNEAAVAAEDEVNARLKRRR